MSHDKGSSQPSSSPSDAQDHQPANRAERRARKKGGSATPPAAKNLVARKQNLTSGPRLWSNRRSG